MLDVEIIRTTTQKAQRPRLQEGTWTKSAWVDSAKSNFSKLQISTSTHVSRFAYTFWMHCERRTGRPRILPTATSWPRSLTTTRRLAKSHERTSLWYCRVNFAGNLSKTLLLTKRTLPVRFYCLGCAFSKLILEDLVGLLQHAVLPYTL